MKQNASYRALMEAAVAAREYAYAPYSEYRVGAALLCKDGRIYTGCNIENAGYTPTNCAERTAIFKAVSEGVREFAAIAVVGGKDALSADCTPCGICRQVLAEFCPPDLPIILGIPDDLRVYTLSELLPLAFTKKEL
jgi:cytidine deaminase